MTIMGIVIASQEKKKELDKNAKKIKRKKGQYAQQRLFFKPRTNLEGRKRYRWGSNKNLFPTNVVNPLTCKVPSFVDFVETKETRFFFYMLEDWNFRERLNPVEEELACRALLHWRLRLMTGSVDDEEKKIIKFYLKTASKIIDDTMPRKSFWPYSDGLVHVYNIQKDRSYKNRNRNSAYISFNNDEPKKFYDFFNQFKEKLLPYERDIINENNLKKKETYWIRTLKSIFTKKDLPDMVQLKSTFNYQNLDLIVSSYISWKHNIIKPHKKEPSKGLITDWKLIYSIYKELELLKNKNPEKFKTNDVMVMSI